MNSIKNTIKNDLEKLYNFISNEEDARVCKDISEEACTSVPRNFFLMVITNVLTKIGDALSSPKTVLAWLMNFVGAPLYLVGFLVPIRESGSMLPQILIAGFIRKKPLRKWVWIVGSYFQPISILCMGMTAYFLKGASAGWLIILFLVTFSLSRGLCSIASKDIKGKVIPKTRRGRLGGVTASVSGFIVIAVGVFLLINQDGSQSAEFYGTLVILSAFLWVAAATLFIKLKEEPGETGGGGNAIKEAVERLSILKTDIPFRNFVITRALLLCSALTAPYYILLAQQNYGTDAFLLGMFIIANGLASSLSAVFWGKMADSSSKQVMIYAALITSSLGFVTFLIIQYLPVVSSTSWIYPLLFFILGIAHSGVRLGRKTYVLDLAGGNKRTDYVAVSNTLIGFILLLTGSVGALSTFLPPEGIILILSLFGLGGAVMGRSLPDVEN